MKTEKAPERVVAEFRRWGMRGCKLIGQWKGYDVWAHSPVDRLDIVCSGGPYFVLDDGENARGTTPKEGYEVHDYFFPHP